MNQLPLRIATRQSPLALWQAHYVKAQLALLDPSLETQLVPFVTKGDIILETPLAKIGGKGLFIKELEVALLNNKADIAVHSMKDLPMDLPDGLQLTAICEREDPRDAFVSNHYDTLAQLPKGAVIGTSSLRRQCQIMAIRPDLIIKDLRGNVGTRLSKLDNGEYDAIILAVAGLTRLKLKDRIRCAIEPNIILPAVGQGAVGIETRINDERINNLISQLNDPMTHLRVCCERAMNSQLMGGCQVPIGSYAEIIDDRLYLRALVGDITNGQIISAEGSDHVKNSVPLGIAVAKKLLAQGAAALLAHLPH